MTEVFFGQEDEPDARFVQLEDCKHIFEVRVGFTLELNLVLCHFLAQHAFCVARYVALYATNMTFVCLSVCCDRIVQRKG